MRQVQDEEEGKNWQAVTAPKTPGDQKDQKDQEALVHIPSIDEHQA
jgi:hypothetical protein